MTYLDSLESALSNGSPEDVLAFLRVLRMNGLTDKASAQLVKTFSDGSVVADDFERVRRWIQDQRATLDVGADDDVDDDGVDALLDELGDFDPFKEDGFVSVTDDISEFDDFDDASFDDISVDIGDVPALETESELESAAESLDAFSASKEFSSEDLFGPLDTGEDDSATTNAGDDFGNMTPPPQEPQDDRGVCDGCRSVGQFLSPIARSDNDRRNPTVAALPDH